MRNITKFKKGLVIATMAFATMLGTVTNVLANQGQQQLQVSPWAIGTLNEGEKYDIYPLTWYFDGFQEPISEERLKELIKKTEAKIKTLGLKTRTDFKESPTKIDGTRGNVITALYNVIAQYELPATLGTKEVSAVEYFKQRGIVAGTAKGLELDKPCTVEQAAVLATKLVEDTYNALEAGGKGFLWKVEKGENKVYLLGSLHMGDTSMYPVVKPLKDAFKESDVLLVEANLLGNQEGRQAFSKMTTYHDGTTLKDHVSKETFDKTMKVTDKLGLPKETFVNSKPWSITNDLTVMAASESGTSEGSRQTALLGIDNYFLILAALNQKPIGELEGLKFQAEMFDSLSPEIQETNLSNMLDAFLSPVKEGEAEEKVENPIHVWQKQWQAGDLEEFKKSFGTNANEQNEYQKMLFGKRDQNMANKIAKLLEKEGKTTYFVVVGAGHLTVEGTMIDQLEDKGYTVEYVK